MEVVGQDAQRAGPPPSNLQCSLHLRIGVLSNHLAPPFSAAGREAVSVLARNPTNAAFGSSPGPDTCSRGTLHARLSFSRPAWQQLPTLTGSRQRYTAGLHVSQIQSQSQGDVTWPSHSDSGRCKRAVQGCGGASEGKDSCCALYHGTGKGPSGCACSCALGRTGGEALGCSISHRRDSRSLFAKQADSTTNNTANCALAVTPEGGSRCAKCGAGNSAGCSCDCTPADNSTRGTGCAPGGVHGGNAVFFGRAVREPERHCVTGRHCGSFLASTEALARVPGGAAGDPGARSDHRRDNRVLYARAARDPGCHQGSFLATGTLVGVPETGGMPRGDSRQLFGRPCREETKVGNSTFLTGGALVGVAETGGVPRGDSRQLFGRPCSEGTKVANTTADAEAAIAGAALLQRAKEEGALYSDGARTPVQGTGLAAAPETAWHGERRDSRSLFSSVPPSHSRDAPAVLPAGTNLQSIERPPQAASQARLDSVISSWSSSRGTPHSGVPEGAHGLGAGAQDSGRHVTMVVPLPSGTTARGLQVEIAGDRLLRVVVAGPRRARVLFEGPLPTGVASVMSSQAVLRDSALYLSFPKA